MIRCAPACAQALADMKLSPNGPKIYVQAVPGKHAEKFDIEQIGDGMQLPKEARSLEYEESE